MTSRSTNYSFVSRYIRHVNASNVLIFFTVLALICANVPILKEWYFNLWQQKIFFSVGNFNFFSHGRNTMNLGDFVNDFVGLEIKREIKVGELSSLNKAMLPVIGALGGMLIPVLVFWLVCPDNELMRRGLAIPMATDIAFSLGVLTIFSKRVPLGLKVFLAALAVVDDLGGIVIIAVFYSSHIEAMYIILSCICTAVMIMANFFGIRSKYFYVCAGVVLWYLMLNSGIHATIAGVIVAFCVPATLAEGSKGYLNAIRNLISRFKAADLDERGKIFVWSNNEIHMLKKIESATDKLISPLQDLEDNLHFLINYIVIPLFAFANAGICFSGMSIGSIFSGVGLAVMMGLVVGKFVGVFTFSWLAVRTKIVKLPTNTTWKSFAGVCMLCGIGFTVSMFIADLSYSVEGLDCAAILDQAKLGILLGSVIAAVAGSLMLRKYLPAAE